MNQSEIIMQNKGKHCRGDVLEHSASIVEGTVRLLAKDTHGELYTVGMARRETLSG